MERRAFIQKSVLATTAISTGLPVSTGPDNASKDIFELRVYESRSTKNLENYLSKALIPALNKLGVKTVGAFSEIGKSEPAKSYLLIPYSSMQDLATIHAQLKKDSDYALASQEYNQLPVDQAPYFRYDTSLMIAFDGLPKLVVPENKPRIFELRTYEGYSDDAVRRKIKMFNESEFVIFNRTKLTPVFFGEVIAGKDLPHLTYMITFKNMEEREANWKAFSADPEWQKILKAPEYANTVSKIYKTFLEPLPFSQI